MVYEMPIAFVIHVKIIKIRIHLLPLFLNLKNLRLIWSVNSWYLL